MNTTELLDQFVIEAREGLEAIGKRLLDVEREPGNAELMNDLFRSVHTLKGNCGLFDLKPLEQVVHAGEDVLDRVRHGEMGYSPELADALLEAMDYTAELVERIASEGSLAGVATTRSGELAAALRALIVPGAAATPAVAAAAAAAVATGAPPAWLAAVPPQLLERHAGATALRYAPEPDAFFKGEDPWRLLLTAPGLQFVQAAAQEPWPAGEELAGWDCYRCNLALLAVSDAPRATLEDHFRFVPEQVELHAIALPERVQRLVEEQAAALWSEQAALLARPNLGAASTQAVRRVLRGLLLAGRDDAAALVAQLDAVPDAGLAAWARQHQAGVAPAAAPAETAARDEAQGDRGQRVLRVGQEKVDRLMDLIGEMVVAKNALPYLAERAETVFAQREMAREIKAQYAVINRIAEDMQRAIMEVRMLPVGVVFQRFGRLVRDISRKLGKDVRLVMEGEDTEADKNVIESLADPLIHIVRNSLDHGIELPAVRQAAGKPAQGTLRIAARQEADRVLIEISDDGAGIDAQRVRAKAVERGLIAADRADAMTDAQAAQLVFLPGFSTAEKITDLSGRGVGMDVVRTAVERVNGQVVLESRPGAGTVVRLSLPLSMAVTNVMIIEAGGRRFGVPMDAIVETVRIAPDAVHRVKDTRSTVLRGRIVPLRGLNELLALDGDEVSNDEGKLAVLVVRIGAEQVGLVIDDFAGTTDIILKPLEGVLAGLTGFAGTALMGDGSVLMVVNPRELF